MFHIVVHNSITFMCMADEVRVTSAPRAVYFAYMVCHLPLSSTALPMQGLGRRIPFAFLEDIKQRFESAYGASAASAVAYEYNTEFSHTLQVHFA